MKKSILVLMVLVSLLITRCLAQDNPKVFANTPNPPQKEGVWDFGQVKEGLNLKHDFILKNKSEKSLNIIGTNNSCGCVVSKIQKSTLLSGEETVIEAKFNSVGYSGPVEQFVYVNTDDPQNPVSKFTIKAEVLKSTEGPYATWDFGKVKEGTIAEHNFVLKNKSQKTLNILEVKTTCGCTGSKIQKNSLLAGEETFLEVKFNTKGYSGPTDKTIYVQTDDPDNPLLNFIIKAEVIK